MKLWLLIVLSTSLLASMSWAQSAWTRSLSAFEASDYVRARKEIDRALAAGEIDRADWNFALGNIEFRSGQTLAAVHRYRSAQVLGDRGEDLAFNLTFAEQALGMKPRENAATVLSPKTTCRLMAGVLLALGLVLLSTMGRRKGLLWGTGLVLFACALGGGAYFMKDEAIMALVLEAAPRRSFPLQEAPTRGELVPGQDVVVEEFSDRWARIRQGDEEAWVRREALGLYR